MPVRWTRELGRAAGVRGSVVRRGIAGWRDATGRHPGRAQRGNHVAGLRDKYCIVGIGETSYSRNSGRSTRDLGTEAVRNAMADAGLHPWDVDGMLNYHVGDSTLSQTIATTSASGSTSTRTPSAVGSSTEAIVGIATGVIEAGYVPHRGHLPLDERLLGDAPGRLAGHRAASGPGGGRRRPGHRALRDDQPGAEVPVHLRPPHVRVRDDQRAAGPRQGGLQQPRLQQPQGLLQQAASRSTTCSTPAGSSSPPATCSTAASRPTTPPASSSPRPTGPATSASARSASCRWPAGSTSRSRACRHYQCDPITRQAGYYASRIVFRNAGVEPEDIQLTGCYDAFTFTPVLLFEGYGFCDPGEGGEYVSSGIIDLGGARPNNTSGGHLCEGYTHGMNMVIENVRQLRHQADDSCPGWQRGRAHLRLPRGRVPPGQRRRAGHEHGVGHAGGDQRPDPGEVAMAAYMDLSLGRPADRLRAPRLLRGSPGRAGWSSSAARRAGCCAASIGAACPFCTSRGLGVAAGERQRGDLQLPDRDPGHPAGLRRLGALPGRAGRAGRAARRALAVGRWRTRRSRVRLIANLVRRDDPTRPEAEANVAIGKRVEVCFVDLDRRLRPPPVPSQ